MNRVLRSVASNYVALAAQIAWLVALTPFLSSQRGADELGAWTVAMAVAGYLRLVDLGLGPTFARFVAADVTQARRSDLLSSSVALLAAAAVVAGAAGGVVAAFADSVFTSGTAIGAAIGVAVAGQAVQIPLRAFGHLLYGLEFIVERNAFVVARLLASLAATIAGVLAGWSLPAYLALSMGAEIAVGLAQWAYAYRVSSARVRWSGVRRDTVGAVGSFSVATFGLQAATPIVFYSDAVVVGAALGTRQAGVYAVAMRLAEGVSALIGQVADALMPTLARLQAGARGADARAIALLGAPVLLVAACPALAVLCGLGEPVIRLWVGEDFDAAVLPLLLLGLGLAFSAPLRVPVMWALGSGRHHRLAAIAIAEAGANVVLSVLLVSPWGLSGVAAASLITFVVSNGVLLPRVLSVELAEPASRWYFRPLARVTAVTVPLAGLAALAGTPDAGPVMTGLLAGVLALAVGGAAIAAGLSADQRRGLIGALRQS